MRGGDVHAAPGPVVEQAAHVLGEGFRRNRDGLVGAVDAEARQPVTVHHGRQRMIDGIADDAGPARRRHRASAPCWRRNSSSGRSGRPRTVK